MMPEERPRLGERFGAVRIITAAETMADGLAPVPWVVPDALPHRCKTFRTALSRLASQGRFGSQGSASIAATG
jgi:hypothetical protein